MCHVKQVQLTHVGEFLKLPILVIATTHFVINIAFCNEISRFSIENLTNGVINFLSYFVIK